MRFAPRCHCERMRSNLHVQAATDHDANRKVAPARHALDAQRDHRQLGKLHGAILRIALAQQRLRAVMLRPIGQDLGAPAQHHPAEPRPVLVVAIGDEGDGRVLHHVAQPLQWPAGCRFGFSSMVM